MAPKKRKSRDRQPTLTDTPKWKAAKPASAKQVSPKKIAANRANAKRSTGPRTPTGKARARSNAGRLGFFTERLLVECAARDEDAGRVAEVERHWRVELRPATAAESDIVEMIVRAHVQAARYAEIEGILLERLARDTAGLERWMRGASSRRAAIASCEREARRWMDELRKMQARRAKGGDAPGAPVTDAKSYAKPATPGFVTPTEDPPAPRWPAGFEDDPVDDEDENGDEYYDEDEDDPYDPDLDIPAKYRDPVPYPGQSDAPELEASLAGRDGSDSRDDADSGDGGDGSGEAQDEGVIVGLRQTEDGEL
jgi:hypothetical protein